MSAYGATNRYGYTLHMKTLKEPLYKSDGILFQCYRWQQCYKQIVMILSKNEHISIEVYLGPEHRCILLEQWVIEQNHT